MKKINHPPVYGCRKCGTHARVLSATVQQGNSLAVSLLERERRIETMRLSKCARCMCCSVNTIVVLTLAGGLAINMRNL